MIPNLTECIAAHGSSRYKLLHLPATPSNLTPSASAGTSHQAAGIKNLATMLCAESCRASDSSQNDHYLHGPPDH